MLKPTEREAACPVDIGGSQIYAIPIYADRGRGTFSTGTTQM